MIVGDRRAWVRDVSMTAASSLVFALLGPFGTNQIPLQIRVLEFFAIGFASFLVLWPPIRLALRLGDRHGLPELFVLLGGLTVLTLPATLIGGLIVKLFSPALPPMNVAKVYFMILAMIVPFGTAYMMVERRLLDRPRASAAPPAEDLATSPEPPKLLGQISPRLGREVLALQGEDHYVRVHTPLGSELLLMRLRDAIADLEGLAGEQVHRSWWIAREAVAAVRAKDRRLQITLTNGLEIPVSREAASKLRRAGWLER